MLLLLPLTFVSLLAALCVPYFYYTGQETKAKAILYQLDYTGAVLFFDDAKYTISARCYVSKHWLARATRFCLDRVDTDHCRKAAVKEGLVVQPVEEIQ